MFKSRQYRAKATQYGELVGSSADAEASRKFQGLKFQGLEERFVAAIIMQWNALPTSLQREIFDTAGSVGKLWETAVLRVQIARFLHKHKNESGCIKLPLIEDAAGDATSGAAALSRWDNEGGAVRSGLPT